MNTTLYTVGQIARIHKVPLHRVLYLIRSREIAHAAKAGRYRLYDLAAIKKIREELKPETKRAD